MSIAPPSPRLSARLTDADTGAPLAVGAIATPWGPAAVAAGPEGVHAFGLLATPDEIARSVARRTRRPALAGRDAPADARSVVRFAADEVDRYVAEGPQFGRWRVPVALAGLSDWDLRILGAVSTIPCGATASYGGVARLAGSAGAARAAGGAVGRNPIGLLIPCHRVVAGDGTIGGYGGSWPADREALIALKRALLAHEGVELPVRRPSR